MNFSQWLISESTIEIPISRLYGWKPKILETIEEIKNNQLSFNSSKPILVSRLDFPRGSFYVMDGHHRVIETMMKNKNTIVGIVDLYLPRIERTDGGYKGMLAEKIPFKDVLKLFA